MTSEENSTRILLQFAPLQSFVSPTFWHKLAEIKLDYDRLSDAPKPIHGYYTNRNAKVCLLEVDYSAFNCEFKQPKFCHAAYGTLFNKNTIEEFKQCDKNALLTAEGVKLLDDFRTGKVLEEPARLARFFVLSFADLKCYTYFYWFAFPCPLTTTLKLSSKACRFKDIPEIQHFRDILKNVPHEQQQFFVLYANEPNQFLTLKEALGEEQSMDISRVKDYYFCFADPSEYEQPSWLMRTFAAFIFYKCPELVGKDVNFLGLRYDNQMQPDESFLWQVNLTEPLNFEDVESLKFVGWEPNRNNKMGPRSVSMKDSMDPAILAENLIYLNLKLMKWRIVPDLNLDIIANTKCLLFGAGTLGCAVARNLLAWGFKQLTFIDNGKVGFSNPVRQSLYTHADAATQNSYKALTAAESVKLINPNTISAGYVMQIPMPGHTIGESLLHQTKQDLNKIKQLVEEHDVLFLLTDSRESRWLPTLLGATFNKIVINAALGFDSYLVMRHGCAKPSADHVGGGDAVSAISTTVQIGDLKCISGENLGCYFCNDVTAPGNSLKDRTLDQQCTVTRPGVSNIAASYAVELLVSLLQHPQQAKAPAYFSATGDGHAKVPEGLLGIIPHSIRGLLCNYENILPATQKFSQCTACSEKVISEYRAHGNDFLLKVFETTKYLEDLTGISDYKNLNNEILDFDDSDLEMSDADE